MKEARALGLETQSNAVDIGVRVESPAEVYEPITKICYESKLVYFSRSFDDRVRTFCMNPYGFVVTENNAGLQTVNGHSFAHKKSGNTNFAILVSKQFTSPFNEPISYGKYIASLANMLGAGPIVQRLGDLRDGRRSTVERIRRGLVRPTTAVCDAGRFIFSLAIPLFKGYHGDVRSAGSGGAGSKFQAHSSVRRGSEILFFPHSADEPAGNEIQKLLRDWRRSRHHQRACPGLGGRSGGGQRNLCQGRETERGYVNDSKIHKAGNGKNLG